MSTASDRRLRPAPRASSNSRDLSRPLPAALSWTTLIGFVAAFAVVYLVMDLPWWMPALYAVMSVVAFVAYGIDKSSARNEAWRISENTLLTVGLLCGWPGALVAQQLFRHKTRKRSFRRAFWTTVVINVLALAGLLVVATMKGWTLELPWLQVFLDELL